MEFEVRNDDYSMTNMSHLQGHIHVPYDDLVKAFADPGESDGYKTDAEWRIKFKDGTIATIYNYKDGYNYNGPHGLPVEKIKDWHIGGFEQTAVERVVRVIADLYQEPAVY